MAILPIRNCFVVTAILLFAPVFVVLGQDQRNLSELITASQNNLPVLKQKQAQINSARASETETRHSFLPQVKFSEQLNIGSNNSLAGSLFTFGITPSSSGGIRADNTLEPATANIGVIYSEYELVNFGLNKARLQYAGAITGLQEADLQKEKYQIALQVARLYFISLRTQYRLDADRQNVNRYDSIYKIIRALTLSGLKPGSDSSVARAELSKARITYNQSFGNLVQFKEQLSYLTGIPSGQLNYDSLANHFLIHTPIPLIMEPDTLNNPLINYYVKKKDIFLSREGVIKKTYLPKIILAGSAWARGSSIQFNDQFKSLATGLGYQRFNYALGIAFTYNLFNGMYKRDRLAVSRFDTQASEYELQQQKTELNLAYRQAENALATTGSNLTELPVQLTAATSGYQQKLAQYKAGIISLIDLVNASFVLYRSQTDYIETMSDWYLAQLNKAAITGNLAPFIQTLK